jgi:hypothetical protein
MDIKSKTCDIRTWKETFNSQHRNLLTVISPTSTPGWASSATFVRLWENFSTQLWIVLRDKILYEYPLHLVLFAHKKNAQQNAPLRYYTPHTWSPFWLLKPDSEHAHALLLPRLSWSWTVHLPSDTHRKPIFFFIGTTAPVGLGLPPWNSPFHFGLLDLW